MGTLTTVNQSTGRLDDIACYARGAAVSGCASLVASALVSANSEVTQTTAIVLAILCGNAGGQYALQKRGEGKFTGTVDVINSFYKTAVIQSFIEVGEAFCVSRFPCLAALGVIGGYIMMPRLSTIASAITNLANAATAAATALDTLKTEKAVSKAIEAVEGAKPYPVRIEEYELGNQHKSVVELCAVVPKDCESLKNDLQALGFELVDTGFADGTRAMIFHKDSSMLFRVALFENEADLTSHMEPAPAETVSPTEEEPAVEQIQSEIIIATEEEPVEF